jgi:peptide/nickel transport system substrate-binding protein
MSQGSTGRTRWSESRNTRRSVLATGVTGAAGAAALALIAGACSDRDETSRSTGSGGTGSATGSQIPNGEGGFPATFEEARARYNWRNFRNIPGQDQGPTYGGAFAQSQGEPGSWDVMGPLVVQLAAHTGRLYNGLLTYPQSDFENASKSTVQGDLAESWEQPDDVTFVFRLHPNIRFQDKPPVNGRALTAEDVVTGYKALAQAPVQQTRYSDVVSMSAPDERTVVFKVKEPAAYMLNNLMNYYDVVVPRELIENRDLAARDAIGTGPFILESWEPGGNTRLRRNPNYFKKWKHPISGQEHQLPFLDSIELRNFVTNPAGAEAAFRSGELGVFVASDGKVFQQFLRESPELIGQVHTPSPSVPWHYAFKLEKQVWQDERVRRALSLGFDRDAIIKAVWAGYGAIGYGQDWSFFKDSSGEFREWPWEANEMGNWHHLDIAEAKKLLAAAGYDDKSKLKFKLQGSPTGARANVDLIVADSWSDNLPIEVEVVPLEAVNYAAAHITRAYDDVYGGSVIGPFFDPDGWSYGVLYSKANTVSTYGPNQFGVVDSELDPLLLKQRTQLNYDERAATLERIRQHDLDKVYRIFATTYYRLSFRRPNVFNQIATIQAWNAGAGGTKGDEKTWVLPRS